MLNIFEHNEIMRKYLSLDFINSKRNSKYLIDITTFNSIATKYNFR